MNIALAITAHPKRLETLSALLPRLINPDGIVPHIFTDDTNAGQWANLRNLLLTLEQGHDYIVVMEDDVWPCVNIVPGIQQALQTLTHYVPHKWPVVGFYCPTKLVDRSRALGYSWVQTRGHISGPCIAVPAQYVRSFIRWADAHWLWTVKHHGDARLAMYCLSTHIPIYLSVPSLVEHIGKESLVGGRWKYGNQPRIAAYYIGANGDALQIDWAAGLMPDCKLPIRHYTLREAVRDSTTQLRLDYIDHLINDGPYIPGPLLW